MTASPELLILACEALETRPYPDLWTGGFAAFRRQWRMLHVERGGPLAVSFWTGPAGGAFVLLTEGWPAERRLAAVDHRARNRAPRDRASEGSFLLPGRPFGWRDERLGDFGVFAGWWPCEPGATALRLVRRGGHADVAAGDCGFVLVDWTGAAPVERFEAVEVEGRFGSVATSLVPFTGRHLLESYRRASASLADWDADAADLWAYDLFSVTGDDWFEAVVAFLREADAERDFGLLQRFGAHIYANGHGYYARMERELDAGRIDPAVLAPVLAMERPEFMDEALRLRHRRLVARCA